MFTTCTAAAIVAAVNIAPVLSPPDSFIDFEDNEIPLAGIIFPAEDEEYRSFEIVSAETGEVFYSSDIFLITAVYNEAIEAAKTFAESKGNATLIIHSYEPETFIRIEESKVVFDLNAR